jgi:hypothetical protein
VPSAVAGSLAGTEAKIAAVLEVRESRLEALAVEGAAGLLVDVALADLVASTLVGLGPAVDEVPEVPGVGDAWVEARHRPDGLGVLRVPVDDGHGGRYMVGLDRDGWAATSGCKETITTGLLQPP